MLTHTIVVDVGGRFVLRIGFVRCITIKGILFELVLLSELPRAWLSSCQLGQVLLQRAILNRNGVGSVFCRVCVVTGGRVHWQLHERWWWWHGRGCPALERARGR